jgi:hypothetical protein
MPRELLLKERAIRIVESPDECFARLERGRAKRLLGQRMNRPFRAVWRKWR